MSPEGLAQATREVRWNISPAEAAVMYGLTAVAVAVLLHGVLDKLRRWRLGKATDRVYPVGPRLRLLLLHVAGHARLFADRLAGAYHFVIFWGFVLLFVGTVVVFVHHDLGIPIMRGPFYLYFQSLALDLAGVFALAGTLVALAYRAAGPPRLRTGAWRDPALLGLFAGILVTGYVVEGLRIAGTGDPWGRWSPVGFVLAEWMRSAGVGPATVRVLHRVLWWVHFLLATGFVAYIPYSKLFHLLLAPVNVYLQPLGAPGGTPRPLPLDQEGALGARGWRDLRWKDLFDLEVCTECGRCTAVCPAHATGKPLSPMQLILDLRDTLRARPELSEPLAGGVIREETLWACTTCMACMEACPVFIEHVPKILDLRRYLTMEEGRLPAGMREAVRGLERRGHPWAGTRWSRRDWYRELPVGELRNLGNAGAVDVVYWAGCAVLDERYQKVAQSVVRLLDRAGLRVGVLGPEEQCTGDPARRMGDEFLFQSLMARNRETFDRYGIRRLVTSCPHCYNVFRHEYGREGGWEVIHHTQLLQRLLREGRLKVRAGRGDRVTYHDPCYLARYNGSVQEPREILRRVAGDGFVEMRRSGRNSFCCGAGGGRVWVEEPGPQRPGRVRAAEAADTGAKVLAVACPFCLQMLEDGAKTVSREMQVVDLAELLEAGVEDGEAAETKTQAVQGSRKEEGT